MKPSTEDHKPQFTKEEVEYMFRPKQRPNRWGGKPRPPEEAPEERELEPHELWNGRRS